MTTAVATTVPARAPPTPGQKGVSLHTEARAIRDWQSVCDHVMQRAQSINIETEQFGKLFQSLQSTYAQHRDMTAKMRDSLVTQAEYADVPNYEETAIHQGCDLVRQCLSLMHDEYHALHERLTEQVHEIAAKRDAWREFTARLLPYTDEVKTSYLAQENKLQQTMNIYMQAAENNDRGFFMIAKEYQRVLLQFQETLKTSTDSMQHIIAQIQATETEKQQFERAFEQEFIERVLASEAQVKSVLNGALVKLRELNGEASWEQLTAKLNLYKGADRKLIFEEPVPNKAGALIKSWMQRDMEMQCEVRVQGIAGNAPLHMIVTRWGFVQLYEHPQDIQPKCEFYIYDYQNQDRRYHRHSKAQEQLMNAHLPANELQLRLQVRQHQTFAPLKGVASAYVLLFNEMQDREQFESLMNEFQQTQAPQT